jgi:diguanylate cyclase (GGDEF)-like protein/PAS domain S-box-containing protein
MSEPINHRRILIVDDNQAIHADFRKILVSKTDDALKDLEAAVFGPADTVAVELYELESAFQGQEALARVREAVAAQRPFALAFVDMRMPPGWDGLETIEQLWRADPDLQVVICSAYSDHSREQIVARTGRSHRLVILKKPFDNAEIAQLACAMTEKWRASRIATLKMSDLENEVAHRTADIASANQQLVTKMQKLQEMKKALEVSEERYALAARGANDGLWDWDLTTGHVHYSARWKAIAGLPETQPGDTIEFWLSRVHPNDISNVRNLIDDHLRGESEYFDSEHRLCLANGRELWVLCRGATVRDANGKSCRLAGSLTDISRRKDTEDQLRRGAYYDRLTGLPNHTLLAECMQRAHCAFVNDASQRCALLFLDLDRFKVVNDSLGHLSGDQLLVEVASRLSHAMQRAWGGRGFTLARLGGDEFVILMEGVDSEHDALVVTEAVHRALEQPVSIHGHSMQTTASIGIALCGPEHATAAELLRDADTAMYYAKSAGRARHSIFDRSMRDAAISRLRLETDLREAIPRGDICLHYQPIMCLRSRRVVAIEALARWPHAELGMISPERFISIAEETGLILPLGEHVMRTACHDLRMLRKHYKHGQLCVNVNLSSNQFSDISLVGTIQGIIKEAKIDASALTLEITESTVMDNFEAATATISCLRDLGIAIYLDDFGTGYSSLSCLRSLPLTGLKLDRSFVALISQGVANPAIIHAIVTLAGHLRLKVVAEGIELPEQIAGVIALECDYAQGYLLGKPMPLPALIDWLPDAMTRAIAA